MALLKVVVSLRTSTVPARKDDTCAAELDLIGIHRTCWPVGMVECAVLHSESGAQPCIWG